MKKNIIYRNTLLTVVIFVALLILISPLSLHAGVVFSENFDDGVADGWTVGSGTWAVESFEYSGSGGSQGSGQDVGFATIDTSATTSGMTITADVFTQPGGIGGYIVFDYQGPNNFKIAGSISGYNYWGVGTVTGPASWTWNLLVPETISDATWYRMKLEITGANVKLYVDDYRDGSGYVLKADYTYGSMGSGKVGLSNIWGHAHFDNVSITTPDPAPPVLTIAEPDAAGATVSVGDVYDINYTLDDPDDVVTASFYYDTDNAGYDGVAISGGCAAAAEGTGVTCSWDTSGVPVGSYYIHGLADDGVNPPVEVYSAGQVTIDLPPPAPPVLSILQPDGVNDAVLEGSTYSITYTLSDDDDVVTAAFYYDTDNAGYDGTPIPGCTAAAEGTNVSCSWNTSGMPIGSYYVYAITDDGFHAPVGAYSTGTLTISVSPASGWVTSISQNLEAPNAVTLDSSGRVYIAESAHNRINVYTQNGALVKSVGGFKRPLDIKIDSSNRVLVANHVKKNVEVYDLDFNLLDKLGSGDGEFDKPCALDTDSTGKIYVADCGADQIKVYNFDGSFNFSFGSPGSGAGQFNYPSGIAVDELSGEIIVSDIKISGGMLGKYQAPRIQIYDMSGTYLRWFGLRGVDIGKLFRPARVAVDNSSRIYITDAYERVVQVFDNVGTSLGVIFDMNNQVRTPLGLTVGSSNKLFVTSQNTSKVEVYGIDNYIFMSVSPLMLFFQEDEGSMSTGVQNVQITNGGSAAFTWTASANQSWITLSQVSDTLNPSEMSTINVGVDVTGLTQGTYTGSIDIVTDSGILEIVNVNLKIVAAPLPQLSVAPTSLSFVSINGSVPSSQALMINNTGAGTLNWTSSDDSAWIQMDKTSGTAPDTINVTVDPASLSEGVYTGTITVDGGSATGSPAVIPVSFDVINQTGTINVNTNLAQATFTIAGPAAYAGGGTSWSMPNAPVGSYMIIYGDVPGYITPPAEVKTLPDNSSIIFSGQYTPGAGSINVTTNNPGATFTITGPASYSGSGTSWSAAGAPVGTYTITFGDVSGYLTPPVDTQSMTTGGNIAFDGQYVTLSGNVIAGYGLGQPNTGTIRTFNNNGTLAIWGKNAQYYDYGVNIATGDIDGDGFDEIITAPGNDPTAPADIRIYDRNGSELTHLNIYAFDYQTYLYGATVASADFDGDGYNEVIAGTGADNTIPAYVKIFVYDPAGQQLVDSGIDLFPYTSDWGANVAAGDVDGDGIPELITSPGPGNRNSGVIRIWTVDTASGAGQWSTTLLREFTVPAEYNYSVTIASGDVNGDGLDEIITGDGPHSKARDVVRIFDQDGVLLNVWQAGTAFNGYGANVASGDLDNDGIFEIIVAPGPGSKNAARVKVFDINGVEKANFVPFSAQYGATVAVGYLGLE